MPRCTPRPRPWIKPHFAKAGGSGGVDVLLHDRGDVARGERVQIQLALDRDVDGMGRVIDVVSQPQ